MKNLTIVLGALFLLDSAPSVVLSQSCCVDRNSIINTFAGTGVSGYTGDGGPATSATLGQVFGVCSDAVGNVYICVSDPGNSVIRKVSISGIITTYAGNGTAGYSGDGGPATLAQMNRPSHAALDAAGNLYVTEFQNNVVRKITPGGIISTFAGTGTAGYSGDGGPANLATLNEPFGVTVDFSGNVIVADTWNSVLRKINISGIISTIAGNGTVGYSGDGGPATSALIGFPEAVSVDPYTGAIYFFDDGYGRIRMIDTCGIITTVAGNGALGGTGNGGPATLAELDDVHGFAFCGNNIYFNDLNNGLREIDNCGIVHLLAGPSSSTGDGGPVTLAAVNFPVGLTTDGQGNLYVGEQGGYRVRKISYDCSPTPTPACNTPTPACTVPPTSTFTFTPTATFTPTPTFTATSTPTITNTPTVTFTPTPLCAVQVWPDPYNPNYANGGFLKVDCLPPRAVVSLYTVSGELVRILYENGGLAQWDGHNQSSAWVSPGIYYYVIQQDTRVLGTGKFLVINNR